MKPKDIGTRAETAVVDYLHANGFPGAERRALRGAKDVGDVLVCPGIIAQVKGGKYAEKPRPGHLSKWLHDCEQQRVNAGAEHVWLVLKTARVGHANAGNWRAHRIVWAEGRPVVLHSTLAELVRFAREDGWGDEL